MPDCQSGAVHSVGCGTIIYSAVAGDMAFVTPIVTSGVAAKPNAMGAAAVLDAPVSFQEKETGAGWRTRNGQADRLLLSRWVGWLPQGQEY